MCKETTGRLEIKEIIGKMQIHEYLEIVGLMNSAPQRLLSWDVYFREGLNFEAIEFKASK